MSLVHSLVPVVLATAYLVVQALPGFPHGEIGGVAGALVAIAGILGFVVLSGRSSAQDQLLRMEDAARQLRDAMADADALRKVVQRFHLVQQAAGEDLQQLRDGINAAVAAVEAVDAARVRDIEAAGAELRRDADRAIDSERQTMEQLLDAHGAVWMNSSSESDLVAQLALQLEVPLARAGITSIAGVEVPVDGERHEVVDQESVDDSRDGLVVHVYKPGYSKDGHIVRRARVRVGKSPSLPLPEASEKAIAKTASSPDDNQQQEAS
jgi:molecular chaperone GrpE (heat shock protein)